MASIPLLEFTLSALKKALRTACPAVRSAHLSEAVAAALGFRTHAALLTTVQAQTGEPGIQILNDDRFRARLLDFGYPATEGFSFESLIDCPVLTLAGQKPSVPTVAASIPNGAGPKEHSVIISGFLKDVQTSKVSILGHEYLDTKYPRRRYTKCCRIPRQWCVTNRMESSVRERILTAVRAIAFMDATNLRPSDAHTRLYGHGKGPEGFDHSCVWIDDGRRYVVTTEPYTRPYELDRAIAWCESNGWSHLVLPRQIGIWNPCRCSCTSNCTEHTCMLVAAPPKNGGNIEAVRDALLRSEPFPEKLSF